VEALFLEQAAVSRLIDRQELLDALADGFRSLSAGEVVAPPRIEVSVDAGFSLSMPAYRPGGHIGVKIVNVFDGNASLGLPSHLALIALFDAKTGACVAVMDGTEITALRTAGAAALSARVLAREDARVLTIIGAGVQGQAHLGTLPLVRGIDEIRVSSLDPADAERLAARDPRAGAVASSDLEAAVSTSDVVCLCTHSGEPVIDADWVRAGTHVTSVGYREPRGELPRELLDRGRLFVESRLAVEPPPTGCYELEGVDPAAATELGEVLDGALPGRVSADEITVYKAMGHAVEDLVAAELALRTAVREGGGLRVPL
jgi:ornithine cyclodeaminase/alanine dehydrogenase-like protein (mu-crystallin family)